MNAHAIQRALALIALGAASASPAWALTAEQVYAKVSSGVWRVRTYDADNLPLAQGSAVVIAPGSAVTNCHVLAKAKRVSLQREKEAHDATLELWDVKRDLCQLTAPQLKAAPVTVGESSKIAVGQSAFAIGNPKGLELTMSAGLVSSLRRNAEGQLVLIQTSAAISGGSSGGGLFDDQGASDRPDDDRLGHRRRAKSQLRHPIGLGARAAGAPCPGQGTGAKRQRQRRKRRSRRARCHHRAGRHGRAGLCTQQRRRHRAHRRPRSAAVCQRAHARRATVPSWPGRCRAPS